MADQSTGREWTAATADDLRAAATAFFPSGGRNATIEPLPGGFSGSPLARVALPCGGFWALKALPATIDATGAGRLHRLLQHLRSGSLEWIPHVAALPDGGSVWRDVAGRHWEMLTWMPGQPQFQPNAAERAAAVAAVAATHARATSFPEMPAIVAPAPSLGERVARCRRLDANSWRQRLARATGGLAVVMTSDRPAAERIGSGLAAAADVLAYQGGPPLARAGACEPVPERLVMVVRDLTADHLLFDEPVCDATRGLPRVSGLIDFHAARRDTPACDLGRLLASWHGGLPPPTAIQEAVASYCSWLVGHGLEPPGAEAMCWRVEWIAATAIVLGLDNWLRWIVEEQRQFPDWALVADRIEQHAAALPEALQRLEDLPVFPPKDGFPIATAADSRTARIYGVDL